MIASNGQNMLELTDDLIFAKGGRRVCYVHPYDSGKCVKILGPNGDPCKRRRKAPWYKKLRPLAMFDDNRREVKSFKVLERHGSAVWDHFPRCYGIEETCCGPGMVTDLIRNEDDCVSLTVHEYILKNGQTPELQSALNEFFEFLKREVVITRDILDHNMIVREASSGLTIMMIDGFGSSESIPFSIWFKPLGVQKVERKIKRFRDRYDFGEAH